MGTLVSSNVSNHSLASSSSWSFPLKLSMAPFSHGLPGSINRIYTSIRSSQPRTRFAVNSGPLSERRYPGTPRWIKRSLSRSGKSLLVSLLATSIAKHARIAFDFPKAGHGLLERTGRGHEFSGGMTMGSLRMVLAVASSSAKILL